MRMSLRVMVVVLGGMMIGIPCGVRPRGARSIVMRYNRPTPEVCCLEPTEELPPGRDGDGSLRVLLALCLSLVYSFHSSSEKAPHT